MGLTPLVIGHTESKRSLVFQIIVCTIPLRKINWRVITIPCYYYLCHLGLIGENESAEQTFNEFLTLYGDMKCHHKKLLKMQEAHNKVTEINNAYQKLEVKKYGDKNEPEGVHISGEATATMNNVHDIDSRVSNDFDLH